MNTERIKEIQQATAYPESVSVQQALLKVWNECVQEQLRIGDVSNFVSLAKPNYKAKDGTIKRGIEIDGKYYAPQNDC